ncbi:hypothetical protein ACJ41O_003363 [Fusarium nematophilum]
MKAPLSFLHFTSLLALVAAQRVSYDGYKAFSISVSDNLDQIKDKLSSLDVVSLECEEGHPEHFDVAVSPDSLSDFEALNLEASVLSEDLGADFAVEGAFEDYPETETILEARQSAALPSLSWFNSYHAYADHRRFFDDLRAAFPSNSEIFTTGRSYGGRDIYGIHFWGKDGKGTKPAIFFHATVHAREWIAAPVEEYLAWQLISGYLNNDAEIRAIVDKYDFYFIPFVNPDGFSYSQTNNRLWRKNRQPRSGTSCVGTDGNRNWPFNWQVPGGASTDPCSETFKGRAAADTPEISSIVPFTNQLRDSNGIKLFIDFHSYGQYILLPYGYSCGAVAENHSRQMDIAAGLAQRIFQVNGTRYTYGPSCSTLYASTGSAPDYHAGSARAEYSWTIELRPASSGAGGFVLPPQQIQPTAHETWEGLKYVLRTI